MKYFLTILLFLTFFLPASAENISGTISSNLKTVEAGESFRINISGYSAKGIDALSIYNKGGVRIWRYDGFDYRARPTRANRSWTTRRDNPGTYHFCGRIKGCTGTNIHLCRAKRVKTSPECVKVNVVPEGNDFSVSCSASPSVARVNEKVMFSASVSGGENSYSYTWSGSCTGKTSNCPRSFSSPGDYNVNLKVSSDYISKTASCSVSVKEEDSFAQGSLLVSPIISYPGEPFTITVKGSNEEGLESLGAYYKGGWNIREVSGAESEEKWEVTENIPGTYKYCGVVKGETTVRAKPYCIDVKVLPEKKDECSFVGKRKCLNSNYAAKCELQGGLLKWSSPILCNGNTSYGYGLCKENQKPSWYCYNGECAYNCIGTEKTITEEKKEALFSVSILVKEEEGWSQNLKTERGQDIEFLLVLKNSSEKELNDIKVSLDADKEINLIDYTPFDIEALAPFSTESFRIKGKIAEGEKKELKVLAKAGIDEFYDFSEVGIEVEDNGVLLEASKASMGNLFKSWYFWVFLFVVAFFLLYYIKV